MKKVLSPLTLSDMCCYIITENSDTNNATPATLNDKD